MAKTSSKSKKRAPGVVASNRRARHDYEIVETYECGIELVGPEVKSLREAQVQLRDSYARVESGELWLIGVHIAPYLFAQGFGAVDPDRRRKLLAHRAEIEEMRERTEQEHLALVPLSVYFKEGKAKVELGLGRGRKTYDKRHAIAKRDLEREEARASGRRSKGMDAG